MNSTHPTFEVRTAPPARLPRRDCALVADWRRFLFVHYSLPPEALAPHVPYELDLFEEHAFVSLVFFTLERMRTPFWGSVGEVLLRPISNHPFLNVRTYVNHRGRDGICFLAEWIPNRISEKIGPLTYGLPYRFGEFDHEFRRDDGVARLGIDDPRIGARLAIAYPIALTEERPCEPDTAEDFLLERYRAYTFRGPVRRSFSVAHEPWRIRPVDWIRANTALVERAFPWFKAATFHSAHVSVGVTDVEMGFPHHVED